MYLSGISCVRVHIKNDQFFYSIDNRDDQFATSCRRRLLKRERTPKQKEMCSVSQKKYYAKKKEIDPELVKILNNHFLC